MADVITQKAVEFIDGHREKPFFLYFATHDIHVPRVPHPRFRGATKMGPRGDAIAEFDWSRRPSAEGARRREARRQHACHSDERQRPRVG